MIKLDTIEVQGGIVATTTGSGPFHPAFRVKATGLTYYWPNITFDSEAEAVARARRALNDAFQAAAEQVNSWNVYVA